MTIRRLLRAAGLVALVLAGWATIIVAIPFFGPAGRQVAVVGDPAQAFRAVIAAGGVVVEVRDGTLLARSGAPGFAAALYRHGAVLVLEGRIAGGCSGATSRR